MEQAKTIEAEVISSAESLRFQNDQYFTQRSTQDRDFVYNKLLELADGIWMWHKLPDGSQTRAYKRPPCIKALTILSERAAGRLQPEELKHLQDSGITSYRDIVKSLIDARTNPQRNLSEGSGSSVV